MNRSALGHLAFLSHWLKKTKSFKHRLTIQTLSWPWRMCVWVAWVQLLCGHQISNLIVSIDVDVLKCRVQASCYRVLQFDNLWKWDRRQALLFLGLWRKSLAGFDLCLRESNRRSTLLDSQKDMVDFCLKYFKCALNLECFHRLNMLSHSSFSWFYMF